MALLEAVRETFMAPLVVTLDHPAARLPAVAGGKGASLAKMRASGLPVPPGFVVTTEAFHRSGFTLPQDLEQKLAAVDPADLAALESLSQTVHQAILERQVPDEVISAVSAAYEELGNGVAVAVRSSATAEDQLGASFAGQYDTFLNVVGWEALLGRLRDVWASLYSTRAVSYKLRGGFSHSSVGMAVVVQRQLQLKASGVLFTRDPVTRNEGYYLVNATFGLGEGVVTGEVPSDTFTLMNETWEVTAQTLSTKGQMIAAAPGGGTHSVAVPPEQQESPALTYQQLAELGKLA